MRKILALVVLIPNLVFAAVRLDYTAHLDFEILKSMDDYIREASEAKQKDGSKYGGLYKTIVRPYDSSGRSVRVGIALRCSKEFPTKDGKGCELEFEFPSYGIKADERSPQVQTTAGMTISQSVNILGKTKVAEQAFRAKKLRWYEIGFEIFDNGAGTQDSFTVCRLNDVKDTIQCDLRIRELINRR